MIRSSNLIQSTPFVRPTEVGPREGYRIWLRYSDGAAGEIDLSHLAGRGVFKAWSNRAYFETVHVASHGAVAWGQDIELCPDALYMRLTGATVSEVILGADRLANEA